jgi:carbon storage regulator
MLVLTRHCGEQIVIAEDIIVTVVAIEGNKIRLGIEAPKSVRVDRKEVHDRRMNEYQAERQQGAKAAKPALVS